MRPIVRQLLVDYGFSINVLDKYVEDVADLVFLLGQVKTTDVSYLELQPYRKESFSEDDYNDAVVNIFTRLNTAGRSLSEQEISYAWIKSYWDASKTDGQQADQCFAALRSELLGHGLRLDDDSVVRVVSTVWSVLQNNGSLLSSRDLLKPDHVRRLAVETNERWGRIQRAVLWTAERVETSGLEYRTHYESLNALVVLMAWRAVGSEWVATRHLGAVARDEFEKRIGEVFDRLCVRCFAVTQWARVWAFAAGKSFGTMASDLAQTSRDLQTVSDPAVAAERLAERLEGWLAPLIEEAVASVDAMEVARREQVSQYYLALWVWHRLDQTRSEYSKLVLTDGKKEPSPDVDHLVAAKAWERIIEALSEGERDELLPIVNDLGNCWLMKNNFNISKSDSTTLSFLQRVHDFKSGKITLDGFSLSMCMTDPVLNPKLFDAGAIRDAIESRTQRMKSELKDFVRGLLVPIN